MNSKSKPLWVVACIAAIILVVATSLFCGSCDPYFLKAGHMLILAITLIVLIVYAIDTNRIANVSEKKWEAEITPKLTRDLQTVNPASRDPRTAFALTNHTNYFIEATVNFNFKVYGEKVGFPGPFDGSEIWECLPYRTANNPFRIDEVHAKKGKTIAQMISERNADNRCTQLTMEEEIMFQNELGRSGRIPSRRWYFDFERWPWIPFLTRPK